MEIARRRRVVARAQSVLSNGRVSRETIDGVLTDCVAEVLAIKAEIARATRRREMLLKQSLDDPRVGREIIGLANHIDDLSYSGAELAHAVHHLREQRESVVRRGGDGV